jgi:hypothetical protein
MLAHIKEWLGTHSGCKPTRVRTLETPSQTTTYIFRANLSLAQHEQGATNERAGSKTTTKEEELEATHHENFYVWSRSLESPEDDVLT